MNISTFIGITGNLHNRRVFLQRETIFCQFRTIDSMKATPEKVFLSIVFDIKRVDTVLDLDFITPE